MDGQMDWRKTMNDHLELITERMNDWCVGINLQRRYDFYSLICNSSYRIHYTWEKNMQLDIVPSIS